MKVKPAIIAPSPYFVDPHRTDVSVLFTQEPFIIGQYLEPGSIRPVVANGKYLYGFFIACPGCGRIAFMRAGIPKPKTNPSWVYVGGASVENPTSISLQPGLKFFGCCGWTGKLTDGVFCTE